MVNNKLKVFHLHDGRVIDETNFSIQWGGKRYITALDKRMIVLAAERLATMRKYAIVLAKGTRIIATGQGNSQREAFQSVVASYNEKYPREKMRPKNRVIAAFNFFPTSAINAPLWMLGVDVIYIDASFKKEVWEGEQQFLQNWLGYPKQEENRIVVFDRWDRKDKLLRSAQE